MIVRTFIEANQNSHSPKAAVPKKLMMTTTTPVTVIHTALLVLLSQSIVGQKCYQCWVRHSEAIGRGSKDAQLMRTAAADNSAGMVITHEYQ